MKTATKNTGKRVAIAALALTLAAPFAATAANADPYNGNGHSYSDHRNDRRDDNRNDNNWNQRGNDHGRYQNNNGWNNQYQNNWRRGDRYDQSRFRAFDYRREHYREPPRGYRYVRDDRGDTLLVGILGGVILSQVFNNDRY